MPLCLRRPLRRSGDVGLEIPGLRFREDIILSDEQTDPKVDEFLREPHQPHQYARYAAVRLHDYGAREDTFRVLVAMPPLPEAAAQAELDRGLQVLRMAWEQADPDLARAARWREDAPAVGFRYDMGAPDSGGTVWLHNEWNEMISQFVHALSQRIMRA